MVLGAEFVESFLEVSADDARFADGVRDGDVPKLAGDGGVE